MGMIQGSINNLITLAAAAKKLNKANQIEEAEEQGKARGTAQAEAFATEKEKLLTKETEGLINQLETGLQSAEGALTKKGVNLEERGKTIESAKSTLEKLEVWSPEAAEKYKERLGTITQKHETAVERSQKRKDREAAKKQAEEALAIQQEELQASKQKSKEFEKQFLQGTPSEWRLHSGGNK